MMKFLVKIPDKMIDLTQSWETDFRKTGLRTLRTYKPSDFVEDILRCFFDGYGFEELDEIQALKL